MISHLAQIHHAQVFSNGAVTAATTAMADDWNRVKLYFFFSEKQHGAASAAARRGGNQRCAETLARAKGSQAGA